MKPAGCLPECNTENDLVEVDLTGHENAEFVIPDNIKLIHTTDTIHVSETETPLFSFFL